MSSYSAKGNTASVSMNMEWSCLGREWILSKGNLNVIQEVGFFLRNSRQFSSLNPLSEQNED